MKYLFLFLVGYAVKCEDLSNNYFVVEMPDDPQQDVKYSRKPFQVYWNVPTMQCASKRIAFQNLYEKFGIIQNDNDRFIGEKITILYEPGDFPAIFKNESSGKYKLRNGGVPQEGNLEKHLVAFKNDLNLSIPDPNFNGIGIIDFESWRPVFRQNFGILVPYKDVSIEIEKQLHWWWTKPMIQAEASRRFEAAARRFMQTTLSIAKQMRPKALWGYYGFPHCFNMANNNMKETCAKNVPEENNGIYWLWSESTALFPSIYSSAALSASQLSSLINGRVQESVRLRFSNTPVLPYFWFRYRDAGFMSQGDLSVALSTLYKSKASGFIIWGSSNDVNTLDKCNKLFNYVETVLGPNVAKYTKQINRISDELNDINEATTSEPTTVQVMLNEVENSTSLTRMGQIDPEFEWIPPKNYSQDISKQVDEELTKKGYNKTADDYKALGQAAVLDLIFDALINAQNNMGSKNVRETKEHSINYIYTGYNETVDNIFAESPIATADTDNINSKEITSTESSTYFNEYKELFNNRETKITSSVFDGYTNNDHTQTYNKTSETYETTESNMDAFVTTENENIIDKFLTSAEERSDYLIIAGKQKNSDSSNIYGSTERDNIIINNYHDEQTTEFNLDKIDELFTSQIENRGNKGNRENRENIENKENEGFKETTDDLDQVVTYVYRK